MTKNGKMYLIMAGIPQAILFSVLVHFWSKSGSGGWPPWIIPYAAPATFLVLIIEAILLAWCTPEAPRVKR